MLDKSALLVSLADKIHNSLWYYEEAAKAFLEHLPGPLADELKEIVDALKQE